MPIRVVFFDFGNTLAAVPEFVRQPWNVWIVSGAELSLRLTGSAVRGAIEGVDTDLGGRIYQYVGRTGEFWRRYDEMIMDRLGLRDKREELLDAVERSFSDPSRVQLFPESIEVLESLRSRGFHLGLISNHHEGLLRVLEHHGLDRLLETVTFSQEVGAEKPDPRFFRVALNRAGSSPDEAVHFGDSMETDILGSQKVGMRAIWVDRTGRGAVPSCPRVTYLRGILPWLERDSGIDPATTMRSK
jgi:HAD superfamily hydrolase (TIGR01509 family)